MTQLSAATRRSVLLCANRRVGHTWNDPDNQHWERAEDVTVGRRRVERVRCVSTCDRCGSQRVEPFLVDKNKHLAERDTMWYRHSDDFKRRDRLSNAESDWQRIPSSVLKFVS